MAVPAAQRCSASTRSLFSSITAVKPTPCPVLYATSKAALLGMTQSLAKEVGRDNIRVNAVAPGLLDSGISTALPPQRRTSAPALAVSLSPAATTPSCVLRAAISGG